MLLGWGALGDGTQEAIVPGSFDALTTRLESQSVTKQIGYGGERATATAQ